MMDAGQAAGTMVNTGSVMAKLIDVMHDSTCLQQETGIG